MEEEAKYFVASGIEKASTATGVDVKVSDSETTKRFVRLLARLLRKLLTDSSAQASTASWAKDTASRSPARQALVCIFTTMEN